MTDLSPRAVAFLAGLASVGVGISDIVLLVSDDNADGHATGFGVMTMIPSWRLVLGATLGASLLPIVATGAWPAYRCLAPAGRWLAGGTAALLAYFLLVGAVCHALFGSIGFVLRARADSTGNEAAALESIGRRQVDLFRPLAILTGVAGVGATVLFTAAVLRGSTCLPTWLVFGNPGLLVAVLYLAPWFVRGRVA